jgi:hypothetical protein
LNIARGVSGLFCPKEKMETTEQITIRAKHLKSNKEPGSCEVFFMIKITR